MTSPEQPRDHAHDKGTERLRRPSRLDRHVESLLTDTGYELRRKVGSGGMGIVYLAADGSGNEVALKLLRPEIADDPRARDRLGREVRALQKLRSDNIAQVIDAELDSPDAFVVTEFIPGPTLEEAVATHGSLHLEAVREIGVILGETLQAIHAEGIVHRDLKPSNVMLRHATARDLTTFDPNAQRLDPVIIDFGIAQAAEDSRLTSTGLMMGTAAYLDPEVVKTNETGPAADWWAWAALLAYAASGREPFGTGRADVIFLRAARGDVDCEGLPPALCEWLRDALRPDPAERAAPEDLIDRLATMDFDAPAGMESPGDSAVVAAGAVAGGAAEHDGVDDTDTREVPVIAEESVTEVLSPFGSDATPTQRIAPLTAEETATRPLPVARPEPTEILERRDDPRRDPTPERGNHGKIGPGVIPQPSAAPGPLPTPLAAPANLPTRPAPPPMPYGGGPIMPAPYGMQPAMLPLPPQLRPAPQRPLLVLLGTLLLIGLGAVSPLTALLLFLLLNAFARAWQRSWVAMTKSRERGAAGGITNAGLIGLALPRFAWGLIEAILLALFPVIAALVIIVVTDAILGWGLSIIVPLGVYGAFLLATTVGLCWIGIDGRTTRKGAHRVSDAAAPGTVWTLVLVALLVLLLIAVGFIIANRSGAIDYFPYVGQFRVEDLAPWRR